MRRKKTKDITPLNNKHQRHGLWKTYDYDGQLLYKCFYHNDKLVGYEECFYYNGDGKLREKTYFL